MDTPQSLTRALITWSNWAAAGTSVRGITSDRVVPEGLNRAARTDQDTVGDVMVDLVKGDFRAGPASARISCPNPIGAVQRDLTFPDPNRGEQSCGIRENAVGGVIREHRISGYDTGRILRVKSIAAIHDPGPINRSLYLPGRGGYDDAIQRAVFDDRVDHFQARIGALNDVNAVLSEAVDPAVVHHQGFSGKITDAVDAAAGPIHRDVPQDDRIIGAGVHNHGGIRQGEKDPREGAGAVNRHALGDGDSSEAARIENGDLAGGRGLGNRSGEGFAGSSPAAGIGVITDTGNPRARGLRVRHGGKTDYESRSRKESNNFGCDHGGCF